MRRREGASPRRSPQGLALGALARSPDLSLRAALPGLDVQVIPADRFILADVDTPADLVAAGRRIAALEAAREVAAAHGLASHPRILADWNDTIVHLAPHPIVARVATSVIAWDKEATCARELAVARHALLRGGPVAAPSMLLPAGPHRAHGHVLTLWELLANEPGEIDPAEAGRALRSLHDSLADYAGPLPHLEERLARTDRAADDLRALTRGDRTFLAARFRKLRAEVFVRPANERVLHGGAHDGNLLRTPAGLRWIDLDTVCHGPLEWDLAHLGEAAAQAFPERDLELLRVMRRLVSAEVAIWCWQSYGRAPEVDEAAHFHLERLRRS